ncbi:MarR family winged helix-turn-helix transcriptional regulator [Paractinoplanes toevensis]|uniref:MarR family transcriptional regulator n=1 Tax=Paractinoplanes toevensis TaxID=571911 RepID=A0A919TI90_9ACTN|nr:MarR family winged helix-turn-helix transcriptional regulator [Actinoplanes toevensis]GIM95712.1 MarR family transcriptional regulator [Actinoplanes toevensis]
MLHDRLGYLLKHVQLSLTEQTGAVLAPLDVTGRELAVLTVLGGPEALAQQQAAAKLGVDRTTMVDLVDALQGKQLVERRPDPADRRRNLVHLTERGRQVLVEGSRVHARAEREFLAALDEDEIRQLKSLLQRVLKE